MTEENEYPKKTGSGNQTMTAYSVEARYDYATPKQIAGQIFDNRWRRIQFEKANLGVPVGPPYQSEMLEKMSLLSYQSAQALRWWFLAIANAEPAGCLCLETKIVKHQIKTSYNCEAVSEMSFIEGREATGISKPNTSLKS